MAVTYVKDFTFPPSFGFKTERYKKGGSVSPDIKSAVTKPAFKDGGHWMQDAVKHPGSLRKSLHVKAGHNIPAAKLEKAEGSSNKKLAARARLAEAFKHAKHAKGGKAGHPSGCGCKMCSGGRVMAKGGKVHSDVAEDKALIRKMVKKEDLKAKGGKVGDTDGSKPDGKFEGERNGFKKGGHKKAMGGLSRATSPKARAAIHAKERATKPKTPKAPKGPSMAALAGALQAAAPQAAPPGMAPGMGAPMGAPPMGGPRPGAGMPPGGPMMADGGHVRHVYVHHISSKGKK